MKWIFKECAEVSTDDFWYDLTDGGYIKPADILADEEQVKKLSAAKRLDSADTNKTIQGFVDGVFWERNTLAAQHGHAPGALRAISAVAQPDRFNTKT